MLKNTCKLISSVSDGIFTHTGTSTPTLAQLYWIPDRQHLYSTTRIFLHHHCWGLAQEHGASGIHGPSRDCPSPFHLLWQHQDVNARLNDQIFPDFLPAWGHSSERATNPSPSQKSVLAPLTLSFAPQQPAATVFCTAQCHLLAALHPSSCMDLYTDPVHSILQPGHGPVSAHTEFWQHCPGAWVRDFGANSSTNKWSPVKNQLGRPRAKPGRIQWKMLNPRMRRSCWTWHFSHI